MGRNHRHAGNDSPRYRLGQASRASHCKTGIADLNFIGIAEDRHRKGRASGCSFLDSQTDDGQVGHGIGSEQVRGQLLPVVQSAGQARRLPGDMVVGHDQTIL